jgi:hypothetical protein
MPTSARNRLNNTYEAVLFFVKNVGKEVYYFNLEEVGEKPQLSYPAEYLLGLTVEDSLTSGFKFPFSLQQWRARVCIKLGCPEGGTVLDPFAGSGTVGEVAVQLGRNAILIEINPDYISLIKKRLG